MSSPSFLVSRFDNVLLGFFLSQGKYGRNLITKFGLDKEKPKRTPATFHFKLSKHDYRERVDQSLYISIIGSLLYLSTS